MDRDWGAIAGALEHALRSGAPAQLQIAGSGTVSIYPDEDCYVTDIRDWDMLYAVGRPQVRVDASVWGAAPSPAHPLTELRWRAAFHGLYQEAGAQPPPLQGLVHLQSWPDLPRVPEELLAPVTRICALLWRKPTVAYLVARILEAPQRQTAALLGVLQEFGHVTVAGPAPARATPDEEVAAADAGHEAASPGAAPPVLAKLWQRLLGLQPA